MQAVVMTGIGGVEKLQYTSIDTPIPQKDEVLIKVLYCGINHLDLLILQGKRPGPKTFPHILGSEIVGETPSGDIVAVYPWTFCGKCSQCKTGNEQICDMGGTIGRTQWGGYAEYVCVPKKNIIRFSKTNVILASGVRPGSEDDSGSSTRMTDYEWILASLCSIVLTGTTVCHLIRRAHIPDKATVLVTGATGGVGTLVVQLLQQKKCTIIAATSHKNKIQFLKKLGVDSVVSIEKMTETGVQYAIDLVGGDTWSKAIKTLEKNGTLVFCSTSKEEMGKVDIGNAFAKQLTILGVYGGNRKDLKTALDLLEKGIFQPVIDSTFPLKNANKEQEKMEKQEVFGKILLAV